MRGLVGESPAKRGIACALVCDKFLWEASGLCVCVWGGMTEGDWGMGGYASVVSPPPPLVVVVLVVRGGAVCGHLIQWQRRRGVFRSYRLIRNWTERGYCVKHASCSRHQKKKICEKNKEKMANTSHCSAVASNLYTSARSTFSINHPPPPPSRPKPVPCHFIISVTPPIFTDLFFTIPVISHLCVVRSLNHSAHQAMRMSSHKMFEDLFVGGGR